MLTIFFRSFFVYKLVNDILVYLRIYISTSWHQQQQQQQQPQQKEPFSSLSSSVVPSSPSSHNPRRMDANELKRVFQMFDRNEDGQITKDELNGFLENMGIFIPDNEVTQMIDNVDVNGDGCIDADQFGALYQTLMDEREGEEDMRKAFEFFDQNGDGFISVNELKSVLASLGLKQGKATEDCEKMIMRVDVDGDGMVNYKEFKQMMRGGGFTGFTN